MENDAVSCLIRGEYDEERVVASLRSLTTELKSPPSIAVVFAAGTWAQRAEDVLELVRVYGKCAQVIGCTAGGLVGSEFESEDEPGLSLILLSLPRTKINLHEFSAQEVQESSGPAYWRSATRSEAEGFDASLVLANPFTFPMDVWLKEWNQAFPGLPCLGGLASGGESEEEVALFHDGQRSKADAIVLTLHGGVRVRCIVSQGCEPIGEPLPITNAQKNVVFTLGSRPAYEVLGEAFQALSDDTRAGAQGNLFAGIAFSEYQDDFKRGDFLIRNILGADPNSGAVAIGANPRIGQTFQFQIRDGKAAERDFRELLRSARRQQFKPFASLVFCCNGRGESLFGVPNHDASVLAQEMGKHASCGFFCNGEIGPVGLQNYIHGYTVAVALLCDAPHSSHL